MHYTKKQIVNMGNEELIANFHIHSVKLTIEAHGRGITKASIQEEKYFVSEISKRFNLKEEYLLRLINQ